VLGAHWLTLVKFVASGAIVTIRLTLVIGLLAAAVALSVGLGRTGRSSLVRWLLTGYVQLFRGSSMFVQLFWAYYVLPLIGLDLSAYEAATIVVALNAGAYGSEIVRAALQAIPREQREACVALNLRSGQALRHVLLPQALVPMLPSLGNLAVQVVNGTAAVSAIGIADLTFQAEAVRVQTGHAFIPYATICAIYYFLATALSWCFEFLEEHFARGHEGTAAWARAGAR